MGENQLDIKCKMKIPYILIILLMFPIVIAQVEVQYSVDNLTWKNATHNDETWNQSLVAGLQSSTFYYFRARENGTSTWTYLTQTTKEGVEEVMVFMIIGTIFLFITGLLVYAFIKTDKTHWKVIYAVALSIMFTTLMRFSMWFIEIVKPEETGLFDAITVYYSLAVKIMYFTIAGACLYLVYFTIKILGSLQQIKREKREREWEEK